MKKYILPVIILLLFTISGKSFAELTGYGCDTSRGKAVKFALADLSSQMMAQVYSELYSLRRTGSQDYVSYKVRVTSELPIFAYVSDYTNGCAVVRFDMEKAPGMYTVEINKTIDTVNNLAAPRAAGEAEGVYINRMSESLALFDSLRELEIVARFLGVEHGSPEYGKPDVERRIAMMRSVSGEIPQIALNIKEQLEYKHFFVMPLLRSGYASEAPFGTLLRRELMSDNLSYNDADYRMGCEYTQATGSVFLLSCQIKDRLGAVKQTSVVQVSSQVCEYAACEPSDASKKLEELGGYFSVNTGLRSDFYTDYGLEPVTLKDGDLINLYARVSDAAELVVFGVQPEDGRIYLIPLSDKSPVYKAGSGDVGKELELIRLKAGKPFGREYIVMFAFKNNAARYLPAYTLNKTTGVFEINGTPATVIAGMLKKLGNTSYSRSDLLFYTEAN